MLEFVTRYLRPLVLPRPPRRQGNARRTRDGRAGAAGVLAFLLGGVSLALVSAAPARCRAAEATARTGATGGNGGNGAAGAGNPASPVTHPASAGSRQVSPERVDEAIKKGVAYLWSKQKPDGRWEEPPQRDGLGHDWTHEQGDSWGGYSAVAVYALLAAEEKKNDPRMLKAVDFLKKADIIGIYPLGLRCQVWLTLGNTAETRALLAADLRKLDAGINRKGRNAGLWDYQTGHGDDPSGVRIDHSISQYGVLGLWAALQLDVPVPADLWKMIDATWRAQQNPDGGWSYLGDGSDPATYPSTPSMTAAGIATLFLTQDVLHGAMINAPAPGAVANYADKKVDDGLNWMTDHFGKVTSNYNWYGVERIGAASGYKYFGKVDWYSEGAAKLIETQSANGAWDTPGDEPHTVLSDTAFALLFLCHGRAPVMMNKLNYSVGADGHLSGASWNQRHRDVANLARFTGHNMESMLNWQIVNLASPVEDWHDAPILYMAGNTALNLTPYEEAKLQTFVRQGGMIVANADAPGAGAPKGGKDEFVESVKVLGKKLFGYEFRPLPPGHPILFNESYKSTRWKDDPGVLGLSNGVRELMVLLPNDAARAWQADATRTDPSKFELGVDLFLYAVDKQDLRSKGQTYLVRPEAPVKRTVPVARLLVGPNPDPEPGGWQRIGAVTTNTNGTALDVRYVRLGDGSLLRPVSPRATTAPTTGPTTAPAEGPAPAPAPPARPQKFKVAHLTGTTAFKLTAGQRKELSDFTAGGGTLIVDAAGGSSAFADSAETELAAIFGGSPKEVGTVLPPTHAVYRMHGAPITAFGWRTFARAHLVGDLKGPRVRAIEEGDRATLFYSREDLSAGMVGESVDGVVGYGPATATAIMRNLILCSVK